MRNGLAVLVALVLAVGGCANTDRNGGGDDDGEDDDANEVKMTMDQLPASARDGLTREAGTGATIGEVEREEENGRTIYEADVTAADGTKWEIAVDESGKLLEKEKDDEEGGKDDDD